MIISNTKGLAHLKATSRVEIFTLLTACTQYSYGTRLLEFFGTKLLRCNGACSPGN